jgi:hypothetical protein
MARNKTSKWSKKNFYLSDAQDYPKALFILVHIYDVGLRVEKDLAQTLQFWRRSEAKGFTLDLEKILETKSEKTD